MRQPTAENYLVGQNVNSAKKLRKPLLTHSISHITFSTPCTNLFLCLSCIFIFLEIIKHNIPKMFCFLPSSIWKWLYKNSPILISFFKCTLMWQLSQYKQTKLFWMKLKTATRAIVWKTHDGFFVQPIPLPPFSVISLLILAILVGRWWCLMVLTCISLMDNNFEYFLCAYRSFI